MFQNSNCLWASISVPLAEKGYAPIVEHRAITGGGINSAYRAMTAEGEPLFVKTNHENGLSMFEAESDGLDELAAAKAIRVPQPLATGSGAGRAWFVSEYIEFGRGKGDSSAKLGRQLATLHRKTDSRFGWFRDNTIGSTLQHNRQSENWVEFYRDQRLGFQLKLATRNGFGGFLISKGERLMA